MISCLCFSKDRPLQLEGYIRSLRECSSEPVRLSVLFKAGDARFADAYSKLKSMFPDVEFIAEENFRRQVTKWLRNTTTQLVMFGCDDVVFKGPFDHGVIDKAFENPDIFGFSLRLGREVMYSGMQKGPIPRPAFIREEPFLLWNWREATDDWGYPFELDCTVYRKVFMDKFLEMLDADSVTHPHWPGAKSSEWGHPNRFEGFGSAMGTGLNAFPLMASFPSAKGVVVTVNRVQEECQNFVYAPEDGMSCEKLLEIWNSGTILDTGAYFGKRHRSIHIGEMLLCRRDDPGQKIATAEYDIIRIMIMDYAEKNPREERRELFAYMRSFDAYFHMPGAETDGQIAFPEGVLEKQDAEKESYPQDSWILSRVSDAAPKKIVETGSSSRLAEDLSRIAPTERERAVTGLPFPDKSVELLVCAGSIGRAGLGRDGGPLDPDGSRKALAEAARVVAPGGRLIGCAPVSREPFVEFNTTRVLRKDDVLEFFPDFELVSELFLFPEPGPPEKVGGLLDFESCEWCFELKRKY